jgi:hypothetical protein
MPKAKLAQLMYTTASDIRITLNFHHSLLRGNPWRQAPCVRAQATYRSIQYS